MNTINFMGVLFSRIGDGDKAIDYYTRSLEGFQQAVGDHHYRTYDVIHNLGDLYWVRGAYREALTCYTQKLRGVEKIYGKCHAETLDLTCIVAKAYVRLNNHEKALEYIHRFLEGREKINGVDHTDTLMAIRWAVEICRGFDKHKYLEFSKLLLELGTDHPDSLSTRRKVVLAYRLLGDHQTALKISIDSVEGWRKCGTKLGSQRGAVLALGSAADTCGLLGDYKKELEYCCQSHELLEKSLDVDHPDVLKNVRMMGSCP